MKIVDSSKAATAGRATLRALVLIGTSATAMAVSSPLMAQDTAPQAAAEEEETAIIVTGSRISRPDLDNSTPTLSIGSELLENRGLANIADLATQLPQFTPSFGSSRTQSTFSGAASSGLNLINLRNLGGGRTLTLTNGRRMAGGTTTSTAVDFNMVPTANIKRIDVITGGASAIYGADAVAGVVNIITDQKFEGLKLGASYGVSERGDNENPNLYAMIGGAFGNGGHATLTAQYDYQGFVGCSSRYLCAEDFAWSPPASPIRGPAAYSAVGANPTFFLTAANGLPAISATRIGESLSYTDANGNLIPFVTSRDGYNRNGARTLAIPTKRIMIAADASYPIIDGVEAFVEFNYGQSDTNAAFEGHPYQSTAAGSLFGGGPGVTGLQASIPVSNPFVPQAIRDAAIARGMTTISWQQRFNNVGDRGATNEREMVRFVGGVRGDFNLIGDRNWNYELSYVYGRTKLNSLTRGLVSTRQLYYGLRVEPNGSGGYQCADPGARASGCVPINPFLPLTDQMKNALNVSAGQKGKSELNDVVAYVSGDLLTLPGGDLGIAFGAEYRTFSGYLDYDTPINNAEVTGNQIGDVSYAKTTTQEAFVEAIAPILGDMPFIHALTLEGAFRYSKPSGKDSYNTWRYGGTFEPVAGLKFRVMRGRAVRAPTPGELSGVGQTFGVVNDPCSFDLRNANATRAANCAAAGIPANYDPPLNVRQSVGGFVGGNPNLNPETATTLTYGVAFTPSFVPGLSITVDRFQIELNDVINTVGRQLKANQCYDTTERLFCNDIVRSTNPNVPGATYVLTSVNDQLINVASINIKGIDVEVRYARPLLGGRITGQAIGTFYDEAKLVPAPGQASTNLLGYAGGSTSDQGFIKFTANSNLGWQSDKGFGFNWNVRYIGKTKTSPFVNTPPFPVIGDRIYHHLRFNARIEKKYEFFFGVDNVLDSKPPFFPTGTAGTQALDTVPGYYDIFGRSYYAGVRLSL